MLPVLWWWVSGKILTAALIIELSEQSLMIKLTKIHRFLAVLLPVSLCCLLFCGAALAADEESPGLNDGKKWRVAYYQGGPIPFYTNIQKEIIKELMRKGWIDEAALPPSALETEPPYWDWLCDEAESGYLEFLPENGYSASWNSEKRGRIRRELQAKLEAGEVDLLLAMGTWAGEDLVNDRHSVPTLVMSASGFEKTGIIKSAEDSGFDHVNVFLDPTFSERQLRMFHRVTGFGKLGVAYENTDEGLRYSYMETVEKVAADQGFELKRCEVLDTTDDREKSRESCLSCYRELAADSDAVFITALLCADEEIDALAALFKKEKIYSYSFFGSDHVKKGILLGASAEASYELHGRHYAANIIKVLSGTRPRDLAQVMELPFLISINRSTAEAIGFDIPQSIVTIARGIYE